MQQHLLSLQTKVNDIIYNPFVSLKEQIKATKLALSNLNDVDDELKKLDISLHELEEFEEMPYGKLERIKGFNKIKSRVLKLIKEVLTKHA